MKRERRISNWLAVLTAAVVVTGCEANRYEIEMRPNGKNVQRELTCWRERTANDKVKLLAFPEGELARIAAAYDAPVPEGTATKHKFVNVFAGEMPSDVGGSGSYTHWETRLGSASAYVERFRGNDDLLADVEKRQLAADRIADLLIDWLASELEGEADFIKLREFLEVRFRRDLKNLSYYGWAYGIVSDREDAAQPECLVRIGQYLVERAYFTPDQLPVLMRVIQETERDGPARLLALLQRFTASKMGVPEDQPIPRCLQFLSDATAVEASINNHLRRTDDFKRLLAEWEQERATNPEATQPEPTAVVGDLLAQAFLPNFHFGRSDQLRVKLATTTAPFLTNGQWDEKAGQVEWAHRTLAADSEPSAFPTFLFAMWSRPDEQTQQARFGRVVLEGVALGNYCFWYRGLTKQEAVEWDEFVASLQPNDDPTKRLREFRFSGESPAPDGDTRDRDLAAIPRELLLLGLAGEAMRK